MQVRTGGNTGIAHITDQLSGRHILSRRYHIMGHVHINGGKTVQMVDADIIACTTGLVRMYTLIKAGLASKYELEAWYTLDEALKLYALYKRDVDIERLQAEDLKSEVSNR